MGILDGVVEWISEQIMHGLDLINTSVLGALGCGMDTFLRYFPAAETMYDIFTAIGIGLILLMWVWNLFKNYWLGVGFEAEHPVKLTFRAIIFITLTYCAKSIVEIVLKIGGTPYDWILSSELPPLSFADFNSVMLVIIGACANGAVTLIVLIIVVLLAWNYLKLLFEAAERYILLGVLVYTAPVAFSMGGSQSTANIFKAWCRMLGGQVFLLLMNAWCLRLFTSMVGTFIALWKLPRGTSSTRAASADCSRACIPPICGFGKVRRRRKNEGSAHKDAPRASAPAAESRQQCAHRSRRAVHSDLTGHVHPGAK